MSEVRVLLIGCGGFMRHHVKNLKAVPEARIVGLCDPSEAAIDAMVAAYPDLADLPRFPDHKTALASWGGDAAIISTPHTQHIGQIEDCFAAGLHVLVEKPLATTVKDSRRAIAARDKAGKVGAVSYQRHGMAGFIEIRKRVMSGELGKLLCVNAHLAQDWLNGTKGTWRQDPALSGGGQFNDSGSHMVDALLWTVCQKPVAVCAFMDNRGAPVDIDSVVNVKFDGGAIANLTVLGNTPVWHERHHYWFDHGAIVLAGNTMSIANKKGEWSDITEWSAAIPPDRNFVQAVLGREEVLAPFESGLDVIALTEAAWASSAGGGPAVRLD